jgi:hypothetical protein
MKPWQPILAAHSTIRLEMALVPTHNFAHMSSWPDLATGPRVYEARLHGVSAAPTIHANLCESFWGGTMRRLGTMPELDMDASFAFCNGYP